MVAALALGALALGVRLSAGPISLDFLTPYVEQGLADAAPDYRIKVGGTRLTWGGFGRAVDFEVTDAAVHDPGGELVADVPAAAIGFSVRALATGVVAPTGIAMRGPDVVLVRQSDGRFTLGLGTALPAGTPPAEMAPAPASGAEGSGPVGGLMGELLAPLGRGGSGGYLQDLSIEEANLVIRDVRSGRIWHAPGARVVMVRDADGIAGDFELPIEVSGTRARVAGAVRYDSTGRRAGAEVQLTDVLPAVFGDLDPALAPLAALGVPVSGTASIAIGSAADGRVAFDLSGSAGVLTLPSRYDAPVPIDSVAVRGTIDFASSRAEIERLDLSARGVTFSGTARVAYGDPLGPAIDGRIEIGSFDTATMIALWPHGMAPGGRAWIAENLRKGRVTSAVLNLAAAPGSFEATPTPLGTYGLDFAFEGLDVSYLGELPPILGASGTGKLAADHLEIAIAGGEADLGQRGRLAVTGGEVRITEFSAVDQIGDIRLAISGPVTAVAALLDRKPLGYPSRYDIDPASLAGSAATKLHFRLPLKADVKLEEMSFEVEAELADFAMPPLWRDLVLTGGTLMVRVDQKGLKAEGEARLGGIPARLSWTENFSPAKGRPSTVLDVSATLDAYARARLSLPEAERLGGPMPTTMRLLGRGPKVTRLDIAADLGPTSVDLGTFGWTKPPGRPARVELSMKPVGGGAVSFDRMVATSEGLEVSGAFDLDAEGNLSRLVLERARVGANDARLDLARQAGGPWVAQVRGRALDLGPWQEEQAKRPPGGRLPDLRIVADVQRLGLRNGVSLDGFSAKLETGDNRYRAASLDGRFLGGETLMVRIVPRPGGRDLVVRTADAASLIRLLGIYDTAEGGKLDIAGRIDDSGAVSHTEGKAVIDGMRLRKAPILARILTLGSLTGISDTLQGEGIWFERLDMPFTQDGDVLRINGARAFGPALGVTADGTVDRGADTLSLAGTIVPAYTLNSVLGSVPVLGRLLTGGAGQGVFALNFSLKGAMADPQISVNPLSALAPGILRDIIGVLDGTNAAARPQTAPVPAPGPAPAPAPAAPKAPPTKP